jgi:hypothetical protein
MADVDLQTLAELLGRRTLQMVMHGNQTNTSQNRTRQLESYIL